MAIFTLTGRNLLSKPFGEDIFILDLSLQMFDDQGFGHILNQISLPYPSRFAIFKPHPSPMALGFEDINLRVRRKKIQGGLFRVRSIPER